MDKEQAIEKIVEALRAAEMRQGCTDYHFYAEKLYADLFPKPSTANREAVVAPELLEKAWEQACWGSDIPDFRKMAKFLNDQILSLFSEPKVLKEELYSLVGRAKKYPSANALES